MKKNLYHKTLGAKTGRALADLPGARTEGAAAAGVQAAPRNALEEELHAIWASLLRGKEFGIDDDFFKLGGNSLKATQMISRIASRFRIGVKLTEVFDNSTIRQLGRLIESREAGSYRTIEPVGEREFYELSHAQRRLWVLSQFEEVTSAYNVPLAYKLTGRLDGDAFRRAFRTLLLRHESLRTIFVTVDGVPLQKVLRPEELDCELRLVDFTAASDAEVSAYVQAQAAIPFDLATGPLIRAELLRLDDETHLCLLVVHHIISDGWSTRVLASELLTLYHAYHEGGADPLPPLRIQYKDYAAWQNDLIENRIQEHRDYWLSRFAGELRPLDLPTDFPRPAVQTYGGDTLVHVMGEPLLGRAHALGHRLNASLFMVLLASVKALLYRYTGQEDITIGTPSAGRDHADLENQVGFFVNTLALRTRFHGGESFSELVQRVRQTTLEAQEHQLYPFDRLVEELNVERDMSRSPLFDMAVVLQNADVKMGGPARFEGVTVEPFGTLDKTSKFDLSFDFRETRDELTLTIEYNTALFTETRVRQIAAQYERLLDAVTRDAATPLYEIDYVPADEKRRLLEEFNDTRVDFREGANLVELFEEQVAHRSEAVAVTCGDESVSYGELNRRANRLGHALIEDGVRPDDVVALLAERGVALLNAILGVYKAGAAYVPLDPRHPTQRIADVLLQSGAKVVLHTEELAHVIAPAVEMLPPEKRPRVRSVEKVLAQERHEENPHVVCAPENLAYVIFTSGSTGRPKGAMLEHRGFLNHLHVMVRDLNLTGSDCIAQTASQCFDISVWQFLTALVIGGRTHIIKDEAAQDPVRLTEEIARGGVTILEVVPSVLRMMLDEGERRSGVAGAGPLATLRWLLPTGEALPPELVRRWFKLHPHVPLLNAYGPTECSDDVSLYLIHEPPPAETVNMPIGRPIANLRLYVLDERLRPVPAGVVGELYVAGEGVGRGYLGDPVRTAEVFLPDLFAIDAGARFYRTGDLARFTPEGELEFLGRIDHQVKVRGFRIELGEIEAALTEHARVRECAVLARGDGGDGPRLVAYLVPQPGAVAPLETGGTKANAESKPSAALTEEFIADVQAHLQSRLPEYMVPSAFVLLEQMPLTPNGKLDRRKLPAPEAPRASDASEYVPPRTPVEELVAGVWATVLRRRVGVHDNFFKLGGHSLMATLVISRLREALHLELSIRSIFANPTVAGLAREIEEALRAGRQKSLPRLERAERGGELPLSYAQEHVWAEEKAAPGDAGARVAVAVGLTGRLDVEALRRAFVEMTTRHELLRTVFPDTGGQPAPVILPEASVALPLTEVGSVDATRRVAEVERRLKDDARLPFDLTRGPLLRLHLLRFEEEDHTLLLTMHRIIGDARSAHLLVREAASAYEALLKGSPAPLPEPAFQYADYAAWQRGWLRGETLEELSDYFLRRLAGARPLELPAAHPRTPSRHTRRAAHVFELQPELSQSLRDLSRDAAASLFMTLAAAFHALLVRYAGRGETVLTTRVANRDRAELEGLIGPFENTVAVRTEAGGELSFKETLARVRHEVLGAFAHRNVPFHILARALSLEPWNASPLLQAALIVESSPVEFEAAGLRFDMLATDDGGEQCDVELRLTERDGGLSGRLEYNAEMFEPDTIGRMARDYEKLLGVVVAEPERPLYQLWGAIQEEATQIIAGFNDDLESF